MNRLKLNIVIAVFAALVVGCGQSGQDSANKSGSENLPTFTFTAIPDQDEQRLRERFDKVAAYLEKNLGVPVKYVPVKSYAAAVTASANNQVQLAWFGGLSGYSSG